MDAAALRVLAQEHLAKTGARGVVAVLVPREGPIAQAAMGTSGRRERAAIDGDTLFEIGSITKAVNGALVADLERAGRLALDDRVDRHLPVSRGWAADSARSATVRELMTHTAGLPRVPRTARFLLDLVLHRDDPYARLTREGLFDFLASHRRGPGPHPFAYSNIAVGLLGHVLAAAGGKPWTDLLRERVLAPLGMSSTDVPVPEGALARFAIGHDARGKPVPYWQLPAIQAAGALRSTANDMSALLRAALQSRPPFAPEVFAPQDRGASAATTRVGYGWLRLAAPGGDLWWHNGGTGGFRSFAAVAPARGMGVAILSNTCIPVDDLGMRLLGAVQEETAR